MAAEKDFANILKQAFDKTLMSKFGAAVPPPPYLTPFGVRHLDVLLGGGLTSSSPVAFSSTPETGKSTCALQFCAIFQAFHKDAVVVYLDAESAAGGESPDIEDRIRTFGIDRDRFLYKPIVMDLKQTFEMVQELIGIKQQLQERTGREIFVLFVWDSIASTSSSKDASSDDPNEVIGFKARELTFNLSKHKQFLSMQRVTFIIIDQVRSNMQIKTVWQAASDEKTVGTFGNFKSATNVSALQHNIRQWLWLSKGEQLKPSDPMGVDGWILNVYTEKNKIAPSHYSVPLVFDKKYGIIPIWSEYYFLSEKTKTERKYWPKEKKLPYPLLITGPTDKRVLEVINPDSGEVMYTSQKFNERKFVEIYNTDANFRQWFDYAVAVSAQQRIEVALFRNNLADGDEERPTGSGTLDECQAALQLDAGEEGAVVMPEETMDETQPEEE